MKNSKKDIKDLGDIYGNTVSNFTLKKEEPVIDEPLKESEVVKNRRKKFSNIFSKIRETYSGN